VASPRLGKRWPRPDGPCPNTWSAIAPQMTNHMLTQRENPEQT